MSSAWSGRGRGRGGGTNGRGGQEGFPALQGNGNGQRGGRGAGQFAERGRPPPNGNEGQGRGWGNPNGANSVARGVEGMNISGGSGGGRGGNHYGQNSRKDGDGDAKPGDKGKKGKRLAFKDRVDLVSTRPEHLNTKRGNGGKQISLVGNFFPIRKQPDWILYNHRVDFKTENGVEETRTSVKKRLLSRASESQTRLGLHIFDGSNLYTINRLQQPMELISQREDDAKFAISITLVGQVSPHDWVYLQFFNIIMRKCLSELKFEQIGRYYYDHSAHIDLRNADSKVKTDFILIPGFITSIRQYEHRLMMCVEITHKVLRTQNCWEVIEEHRRTNRDAVRFKEAVVNTLVSNVVLTRYNNKTYRIDDILWDETPQKRFEFNGNQITIQEYYRNRYQIEIKNLNSPLLVSRPHKRDIHRGDQADILLVPELCLPTGLLESDRNDYNKMRVLSEYLQQAPTKRATTILNFMARLRSSAPTRRVLADWELEFESQALVTIENGRVLAPETLTFRRYGSQEIKNVTVTQNADWTNELKTESQCFMASSQPFKNWVLISPKERNPQGNFYGRSAVELLVGEMMNLGRGMGFEIDRPLEVVNLQDNRLGNYVKAIDDAKNKHRELSLIFTILPSKVTDIYNEVKKRCLVDYGIPNQCMILKHFGGRDPSKLKSVVTKLLVQLNAKKGGEPWRAVFNRKALPGMTMIVGFDVYHPGKGNSGKNSFGAMVSTTNLHTSKFYSTVSKHEQRDEISAYLTADIIKCVKEFVKINKGAAPTNIIFYRDGVGEGQLSYVHNTEVKQLEFALKEYYLSIQKPTPKLVFIVVTKKGNARIMTYNKSWYDNPPPGTIVDDTITLPERYDFYLVAQQAKKDQTVSPTAFNVIHDDVKMTPASLQALTFQQCHMYFNWSGTVAVPSVCQYAHKLAFLTGSALDSRVSAEPRVHPNLCDSLYYL